MSKEILNKLFEESDFEASDIKTPILVACFELLSFQLISTMPEGMVEILRAFYEVPKVINARRPVLISEALALAKKQNPEDEVASYGHVLGCLSIETHHLMHHNHLHAPETSNVMVARDEMIEFLCLFFSVFSGTMRYIWELEQIPEEGQSGINKKFLIANDLEEHVLNLIKIIRQM